MNGTLSRKKLAEYVAQRAADGERLDTLLKELAAYLVESHQTRNYALVVRAIEAALKDRGIVVASVASARQLTDEQRDSIRAMFGGKKVHLNEAVDAELIGGLRVDAPGVRLDTSIKRKLTALKRAKI